MKETPEQIIEIDDRISDAVILNDIVTVWALSDQLDGICRRLGPHMARVMVTIKHILGDALETGKPIDPEMLRRRISSALVSNERKNDA